MRGTIFPVPYAPPLRAQRQLPSTPTFYLAK